MNNDRRYGLNLTMALGVSLGMGVLVGCGGDASDPDRITSAALISTSTASVRLQELTNSCGANQAQDFFKVVNTGTTPIPASDVSIKIWVDDTSGSNIVPRIDTGGCLLDGFGSCVHQVTGVTATPTRLTSACGPDAHHQANWEITISTTDHTAIGAGLVWSNIQLALHLANFTSFNPGTGNWYSECGSGGSYANVAHAAVYVQGSLVTASSGVPPSCVAPKGGQPIPGELPPAVASGAMPLVGPLPGDTPVHLLIGLPVQNQAALQTQIEQVYDPKSPQYRKFLTPAQYGASFGVSPSAYSDLISFAQSNGLTVVSQYTGRTMLAVTGPASAIERAFFVTLNEYRRPDGTTFYAPANEPSANVGVPVLHVNGFDNFAIPKPAQGSGTDSCAPGSTEYGGADFRTAYAHDLSADVTADGDGQTVGLVEFDSFTDGGPQAYAAAFSLGPIPTIVPVPVPIGVPAPNPGKHEPEVALDIEMVMAMAPRAKIVVYEEDPSKDPALILAQLAEDRVPIISNSWTWPHGTLDTLTPNIFQQLAVQGQSFLQASGDAGAYSQVLGSAEPNIQEPIILSSLMTVVGGTLLTTGASAAYSGETAWNRQLNSNNLATGGGFCLGYTDNDSGSNVMYPPLQIPSYQLGINPGNTEVTSGPSGVRMIPDVSLIADQIAVFAHQSGTPAGMISKIPCQGGTSAATALWAGLIALINQQSIKGGGERVGFANPTLYALAADKGSYTMNFNDVTAGTNSLTGITPAHYHAVAGYDLATGLGTPKANLLKLLPPQSCMPGSSLTVLVNGSNVTAYIPNGSWEELFPGVNAVPIEGTGPAGLIPTPNPVNTCGGDSVTGQVVCTANDTDVYIINGTSLTTKTSAANGEQNFSGGTCQTCNVAIDPLHGQAWLSIGTPNGAALQPLDLRTGALGTALIPLGQQTSSEDIAIDAVRGLALSPNEGEENSDLGGAGDYQLVNLTTGAVFNFSPSGGDPAQFGFDMAAEDCSTGIALATDEFTNQIFLTDLTRATFPGSGNTWSAPFNFQAIDAFSTFGAGTNAIAVASNSHLGVVSGEFGTATFGVFVLPPTSGSGTTPPALSDWVEASLPSTPGDNLPWVMGKDPHTLTAYTSPNGSGKQYAVFADDQFDQNSNRTFLAIVDMQALLALPRLNDGDGHTVRDPLVTCTGSGPPASPCVVRYIKISN